jgi:uncharacterized membrane protein YdfJ with MMPL/SSD domain
MKAVFGILTLILVVAALAFMSKQQLASLEGPSGAAAAATTAPQQARSTQDRARENTVRALEQGVQRNKRADEP